jgi:AcrR family transcriptional regulator
MARDTKDRILGTALTLFLEQGMAATRIDQICKQAEVSNGSLFHFFPSKEAIGVTLYVGAIASYQATLLGELAEAHPPAKMLRALVLSHWDWVFAETPRARFLFLQGPPSWHPDAEAQIEQHNGRAQAAFARWLEAPTQRAALCDIPLDAFTPILLGASMMATRAWLRTPLPPPTTMHVSLFADAAVRSLLKDKPDDPV